MTKATIAGGAFATVLVLLALAAGYRALNQDVHPAAATSPAITPSTTPAAAETHPAAETPQGFLYGRITTVDGATYEGRLRWGGDEEAFWGDYFNGFKTREPLGSPTCRQSGCPRSAARSRSSDSRSPAGSARATLGRPFMARFGDIARIEARGRDVRVTLKSGTVFDLDRFEASDFDDGVRVWDGRRGVVDLDSLRIRTIELLPTAAAGRRPRPAARYGAHAAGRLHRLRPVEPGGVRRLRRARRPHRRR